MRPATRNASALFAAADETSAPTRAAAHTASTAFAAVAVLDTAQSPLEPSTPIATCVAKLVTSSAWRWAGRLENFTPFSFQYSTASTTTERSPFTASKAVMAIASQAIFTTLRIHSVLSDAYATNESEPSWTSFAAPTPMNSPVQTNAALVPSHADFPHETTPFCIQSIILEKTPSALGSAFRAIASAWGLRAASALALSRFAAGEVSADSRAFCCSILRKIDIDSRFCPSGFRCPFRCFDPPFFFNCVHSHSKRVGFIRIVHGFRGVLKQCGKLEHEVVIRSGFERRYQITGLREMRLEPGKDVDEFVLEGFFFRHVLSVTRILQKSTTYHGGEQKRGKEKTPLRFVRFHSS